MNRFTNEKIENHVNNAVENLVPDKGEQISSQPVAVASGNEWYLKGTQRKKMSKMAKRIVALAACFMLCFVSVTFMNVHPDASVYLDVNPSIALKVNCFDRVVNATASNTDGETVLSDMDLKNTDLEVAMNAILGSMVKKGFISDQKGTVLLSVESSNQKRADELKSSVAKNIEVNMENMVNTSSVLTQEVHSDDELLSMAEKYGITPGKALLLHKLAEINPQINIDDYANLPMRDFMNLLMKEDIDVREFAEYSGSALFGDVDFDDDKDDVIEDLIEGEDDDDDLDDIDDDDDKDDIDDDKDDIDDDDDLDDDDKDDIDDIDDEDDLYDDDDAYDDIDDEDDDYDYDYEDDYDEDDDDHDDIDDDYDNDDNDDDDDDDTDDIDDADDDLDDND